MSKKSIEQVQNEVTARWAGTEDTPENNIKMAEDFIQELHANGYDLDLIDEMGRTDLEVYEAGPEG